MTEAAAVTVEEMLRWVTNPVLMLPPAERDLLHRCAWAGAFDRDLYDNVLAVGATEPVLPFEELAGHRFVEALPGERYRVQSSYRADLLNAWRETGGETLPLGALPLGALPPGLKELSGQLAAYYRDHEDVYEQLRHLAVSDPDAAGSLFETLFAKADRRFELTRCHAIVQVLEERSGTLALLAARLDPKLEEAAVEKRRRLEARWLWAQEYYWTVTYVERKATRYVLPRLLRGKQGWVIHIHARGGTGKTMFLRAVIARRCVPKDIPCAAINFDDRPHLEGVGEPWRLAYSIAEQLNVQLRGGPFGNFLRENAPYMREAREGSAGIVSRPVLSKEAQADRIDQVADGLYSYRDRPILVLFDTMENLRELGSNLGPLADLVRRLHSRCSSLRVIFCGRYPIVNDPESSIPAAALAGLIREEGSELSLSGFDADEARSYLRRRRRIVDEAVATAILSKSYSDPAHPAVGFNPFKLALLADDVRQHPVDLTAEKIMEYPDADVLYLIERVVSRIVDPQLQWLLRYGVIPRWLTLDFFKEVLAARMLSKLQGDRSGDDKGADKIPESAKQKAFLEEPDRSLDPEVVWRKLESYASASSWVSRATDQADALEFHPDVREPMRRILRDRPDDQPIYRELNLDAAKYFESKARPDPGQAPAAVPGALRREWLRQAVYHWFQARDAAAAPEWVRLLSGARDDPAAQAAVAREGLEAVKAFDNPPAAVLVRAGHTLARAYLLQEGLEGGVDSSQIDSWLATSERLNPPGAPMVPPDDLALLRARLDLRRGNPTGALAACDRALSGTVPRETEIELRLLRADALQALEQSEAPDAYRAALDLAKEVDPARRMAIWTRLGEALMDWERYAEATAVWNELLAAATDEKDAWTAGAAAAALIQTQLAMGLEAEAVTLGERAAGQLKMKLGTTVQRDLALGRIAAEVELARGQTDLAQAELERARGLMRDGRILARHLEEWDPAFRLLEARVAGQLCDAERALRQLRWLVDKVYIPGTPRMLRAQLECAAISIEVAGDLREAAAWLAATETQGQGKVWEVRRQLLEIRRLAASGASNAARAAASELAARPDLPPVPGLRAQVMLEELIQSEPNEDPVKGFVAAVEAVEPPERRLAIAGELKRATGAAPPKSEGARRLVALLPPARGINSKLVLTAVRLADVLHWAGRADGVRRLLRKAEDECSAPLRLARLREVYLAGDRAGQRGKWGTRTSLPDRKDAGAGRPDFLGATFLLEDAERGWGQSPSRTPALAQQLRDQLAEAEKLLTAGPAPLWRVRAGRLLAGMAWFGGQQAEARNALSQYDVLGTLERLGRDGELAAVLGELAASHEERGSWPSAIDERRREAELYRRLEKEAEALAATISLADALLNGGKAQEALDMLQMLRKQLLTTGDAGAAQTRVLGLIAIAFEQLGLLEDARQARQEQMAQVGRGGDAQMAAKTGFRLAMALRDKGDSREALRILQEEVEPVYRHSTSFELYEVLLLTASILEDAGDTQAAEQVYRRIGPGPFDFLPSFMVKEEFRRAGELPTVRERADAMAQILEGWASQLDRDRLQFLGAPEGAVIDEAGLWLNRLQQEVSDADTELSVLGLKAVLCATVGNKPAQAATEARIRQLQEELGKGTLPPGTRESHPQVEAERPADRLRITVRDETAQAWRVTARWGDTDDAPVRESKLEGPLAKILCLRSDQAVSYDFVSELTEAWWEVSAQMGDAFLPKDLRPDFVQSGPFDLAWEAPAGTLGYLPLEILRLREDRLCLALSDRCRYFYRQAPGRRPAITASPALDVLILPEAGFPWVKQSRAASQIPSAQIWRRAAPDLRVKELEPGIEGSLQDFLAAERPTVLQVQAGFAEYGGEAVLNLSTGPDAFRSSEAGPSYTDAREFAYLLRTTKIAPLLVLDPPGSPTVSERVRQLCLRNAFAANLAEREAAAAILCTGLGSALAGEQLLVTLAEGIKSGLPFGEIAGRMRRLALAFILPVGKVWTGEPEWFLEETMAFVGTALFTAEPGQRVSPAKGG